MENFNSDPLLSRYAFNFFDRHIAFKHLAQEMGNSSFFITGGSGLFGAWILSFFNWSVKRKYADPKLTILSRQEFSYSCSVKFIFGDIKNFKNYDLNIHIRCIWLYRRHLRLIDPWTNLISSKFWQRN